MDGKQPGFVRMFVRIGALKRFHFLKKKTADLPVSVEWDRRRSERRSGEPSDARSTRAGERRAASGVDRVQQGDRGRVHRGILLCL